VAVAGVVGSAALIVLSQSVTAMLLSVCLVLVYWLLRFLRRLDSTLGITAALVVAVVGGAAVLTLAVNAEAATTALGRDVTLTGRTVLWTVVLQFVGQAPVLGHGYGSFWLGPIGPSGAIWRIVGWEVPHAHNGVLDLALELGIVGVALFAWVFARTLGRSYNLLVRSAHPAAAWPLVVVMITVLYNTTESTLLSRNSIYWALFVSAACTAYRALQPPRQNPRLTPNVSRRGTAMAKVAREAALALSMGGSAWPLLHGASRPGPRAVGNA
jgi:O-antigen ligase